MPTQKRKNEVDERTRYMFDFSSEPAEKMDVELHSLEPVSFEVRDACVKNVINELHGEIFACAICDEFVQQENVLNLDMHEFYSSEELIRDKLSPASDLPSDLVQHYDCSKVSRDFAGLLLSPRGVCQSSNGTPFWTMCKTCKQSLLDEAVATPPKLAIANGFAIGCLPVKFNTVRKTEMLLVKKVRPDGWICYSRSGANGIKGHSHALEVDLNDVAKTLPRTFPFSVIFAKATATEETRKAEEHRKAYYVRGDVVADLLDWFIKNNPQYSDIKVDEAFLSSLLTNTDVPVPGVIEMDDGDDSEEGFLVSEQTCHTDPLAAHEDFVNDEVTTIPIPNSLPIPNNNIGANYLQKACQQIDQLAANARNPKEAASHATYVVAASNIVFSDSNRNYLLLVFPELFPYGRGDPSDKDHKVKISLKKCVQHYLNLSLGQFMDAEFSLRAYSQVKLKEAMSRCYVTSKTKPDMVKGFGKLLPEQVLAAASYLKEREVRLRRGEGPPEFPENVGSATWFFKSIQSFCAELPHTNAAAIKGSQLLSSYAQRFGRGAVFLTFAPDYNCSTLVIKIGTYNGQCDPNNLGVSTHHQMPIASTKPGASALSFKWILKAVIRHVFGWDTAKKEPLPGGGLFGIVKAFVGAVEEQMRKALHFHVILWVEGWNEALKDALERDSASNLIRIAEYIKSIVTCEIELPFGHKVTCRNGLHGKEAIRQLGPNVLDALKYPGKKSDPGLLKCLLCEAEPIWPRWILFLLSIKEASSQSRYGATMYSFDKVLHFMRQLQTEAIISAAKAQSKARKGTTNHKADSAKEDNLPRQPSQFLAFGCQGTLRRALTTPTHSVPLTRDNIVSHRFTCEPDKSEWDLAVLQYLTITHNPQHTATCLKNKSKACRFKFPYATTDKTTAVILEEDGNKKIQISIKRSAWDAFTVAHNIDLVKGLRCNNCAIIITDPGLFAYISAYSTKFQHEGRTAFTNVYTRFQKRANLKLNEDKSETYKGLSNLLSGIRAYTSDDIVGAPFCAYLLNGGERYVASHDKTIACLPQAVRHLLGNEVHGVVKRIDSEMVIDSFLFDYIFRPASLEHLCYYEFVMIYTRANRCNNTHASRLFIEEHPLYEKACVTKRRSAAVPVILWEKRIPNKKHLLTKTNDSMINDDVRVLRVQYALAYLALFVPFRKPYLTTDITTWHIWRRVKADPTSGIWLGAKEIRGNIQQHYEAVFSKRDDYRPFVESDANDDVDTSDPDACWTTDAIDDDHEEELLNNIVINLSNTGDKNDHPLLKKMGNQNLRTLSDDTNYTRQNSCEFDQANESKTIFQNWKEFDIRSPATSAPEQTSSSRTVHLAGLPHVIPTRVYRICVALKAIQWSGFTGDTSKDSMDMGFDIEAGLSTITMLSLEHELDESQHSVFRVLCCAYMDSLLSSDLTTSTPTFLITKIRNTLLSLMALPEEHIQNRQLLLFVCGGAGSGKTKIIKAFIAFSRMIDPLKDYFTMLGPTGLVAINIGGSTIASFLGKGLGGTYASPKKLSVEKQRAIHASRLIIIDELSMVGASEFSRLDSLLRSVLGNNKPFGNRHIIGFGDFRQLPPVAIASLIQEPKKGDVDAQLGYDLWQNCFHFVLELTTIYRFRNDKDYGDLLKRLRDGNVTLNDIETLNNRHVSLHELPKDVQLIVYDNSDRSAIIHGLTKAYLSFLPPIDKESVQPWKTINHLRVKATFEKDKKRITDSEQLQNLYSYDSTNSEAKLCPIIDIYIGMGVIITTNKAAGQDAIVKKRIGNGTRAKILSVRLKPSAQPKPTTVLEVETYSVLASEISFLAMEHVDPDLKQATNIEGLPPGCFPLRPYSTSFTPNGFSRSNGYRVTQLPMIPSIVATGHKVQGQTITSACIGGFASKNIPKNWFYVVLSRVTTLKGLFLLEKLPTNLQMYKVPQYVLDEEKRLEVYKHASLLRLNNISGTKGIFSTITNTYLTVQVISVSLPITLPPPTTFRTTTLRNPATIIPYRNHNTPLPSVQTPNTSIMRNVFNLPKIPAKNTVLNLVEAVADSPAPRPIKDTLEQADKNKLRLLGQYSYTPWFVNNGGVCHLSAFLAAIDAMIRNSYFMPLLMSAPENNNTTVFGQICNRLISDSHAYDLSNTLVNDLCNADRWISRDPWEDVLNILRISHRLASGVSTSLQYALRETICRLYPSMYECRSPRNASLSTWITLFDDSTLADCFTKFIYEHNGDACPTHGIVAAPVQLTRGHINFLFNPELRRLIDYLPLAITQMLTVKSRCGSCNHTSNVTAQLIQTPRFLMIDVEPVFSHRIGRHFAYDTNFWHTDEILPHLDARYKCVAVGWIRPGHFETTVRINNTWFLRDCLRPNEAKKPLQSFAPSYFQRNNYRPHSLYYVKI